jgi:hypothetical protein
LLLIAGLGFSAAWLAALGRKAVSTHLTVGSLGLRSSARRRKRSLATIGLLACGCFLIVAVGAFRLEANVDAAKRSSGTGGFALIGESTLPVSHDLNARAGRDFYGLNAADLAGVDVVSFRVRDGDDASCLNLNRAQKPRVLGVNPETLQSRHAFTFAEVAKGLTGEKPWLLLKNNDGGKAPRPGMKFPPSPTRIQFSGPWAGKWGTPSITRTNGAGRSSCASWPRWRIPFCRAASSLTSRNL